MRYVFEHRQEARARGTRARDEHYIKFFFSFFIPFSMSTASSSSSSSSITSRELCTYCGDDVSMILPCGHYTCHVCVSDLLTYPNPCCKYGFDGCEKRCGLPFSIEEVLSIEQYKKRNLEEIMGKWWCERCHKEVDKETHGCCWIIPLDHGFQQKKLKLSQRADLLGTYIHTMDEIDNNMYFHCIETTKALTNENHHQKINWRW